jgi:alpha-tubulin suppressor-like RCC1 family protein
VAINSGFRDGGYGELITKDKMLANYSFLIPSNLLGVQLMSWGYNGYGQLGLGDRTDRLSPVQVGSLLDWKNVSCGYQYTVATKTDGSLWAWGGNFSGSLGLGDTTNRSSPVQVGSLLTWKNVAGGGFHTMATKTDGSLWAWGSNNTGNLDSGQLGLGDRIDRSSPVQVGSLYTWNKVACGGSNYTMAIKTDGSLWAWGSNDRGQLGLGNVSGTLSPVQVGSLLTWKDVSCGERHTMAIKTDGSLWAWGNNQGYAPNFYGQLGLGDTTHRSSPVQVGSLLDWKNVSCGAYHTIATKTDGSLWAWGGNDFGQLGLGDINVSRSSPVQVGSLLTWKDARCSSFNNIAIKTDGSLWGWGNNGSSGELGLGITDYAKYSPVQVGSLKNWNSLGTGLGRISATMTAATW